MREATYGDVVGLIISSPARGAIARVLLEGTEDVSGLSRAASIDEDDALRELGRFQAVGAVRPVPGKTLKYRLTKSARAAAEDAFMPIPPFQPRAASLSS